MREVLACEADDEARVVVEVAAPQPARLLGEAEGPLEAEALEAVVADIDRSGADVVWVGLGVPKQEKWMARMRDRLQVPVMCGVGAAFDFHSGRVPMAPAWMQQRGLEWVYRTAQEPRRLLPRYLIHNPRFVAKIAVQLLRERFGRRRRLS